MSGNSLDLICPKCKNIIKNICLMTVDWMIENDCRYYINHIDHCELQKIMENEK